MKDLIERLEKAAGPDRELDAAIRVRVLKGAFPDETIEQRMEYSRKYGQHYTSSIDDALTLLPVSSWDHLVAFKCGIGWYAFIKAPDLTIWESDFDRTSGAIALCIAALKARVAITTSKLEQ